MVQSGSFDSSTPLGEFFTLGDFCTCSQTYQKYAAQINPFPQAEESLQALKDLNYYLLDPITRHFGRDRLQLTYGFCSPDLKRYLNQKDPQTGVKNGRIDPSRDQHMAHERNRKGNYFCDRLGAACDFRVVGVGSDQVMQWILDAQLPFDSLYFYEVTRPIHLSYGPEHKRAIWGFTSTGQPRRIRVY
ncbi:hypothetical protein [Spirulina subsalsa]|uniref:hypothetical protein n=1 Tax=Spirulina subsalsa TaxID=54311 RepID=UPI000313818C|nr:hypothetical protein [Spirulina subsalsa]